MDNTTIMDGTTLALYWVALVFLLLCSSFFSSTETAVMAINRYRIRHQASNGDRQAMRILKMIKRPDRFLVLVLIGNNIVNIAATAIATKLALHYYPEYAFTIVTFALTIIVLIFGEVAPKTIAALKPDFIARKGSLIICTLMWLLSPIVKALNLLSHVIIKFFGIDAKNADGTGLSVEELHSALISENSSVMSQQHKDLLLGVLNLSKISVEEIMVPRNDLYSININDDWKDIQKQVANSPHTRIVFYRDELDDIIGFLHSRDALRLLTKEDFSKEKLLRAIVEPYYIPENTSLLVQLQKFRRNKKRCGLIIDEFGDIQGLVTIDDILEEIVGDFTTSFDTDIEDEIEKQNDGSFILDGQANIRDVNKELSWNLPTSGPVTINGIILEQLGDNPQINREVDIGNYIAIITETDGRSVIKAKIKQKPPEIDKEDENDDNPF